MGGPGSGRKKGSGSKIPSGMKKNTAYGKKGSIDRREFVSNITKKQFAEKYKKTHNKDGSLKIKKVNASWSNG